MSHEMQDYFAFIFLVICVGSVVSELGTTVNLPEGTIQGAIRKTSRYNVTYWSFLGIPYAAPPTGTNRFQPPQPVIKWNGTLDTTSYANICYQTAKDDKRASEDCLYLNVFTPLAAFEKIQNFIALPKKWVIIRWTGRGTIKIHCLVDE
ncbi:hypothetical protein JTB14_010552 [Gonioctena quinquepunctata]|nr:hypothetical protein JTB14_010552 [Gonioctena quinquepunctata]